MKISILVASFYLCFPKITNAFTQKSYVRCLRTPRSQYVDMFVTYRQKSSMSVHRNQRFLSMSPPSNDLKNESYYDAKSKDSSEFVPSDSFLFGVLATAQLFPPLSIIDLPEPWQEYRKIVSYLYFVTTSSLLFYLGAKRQDIPLSSPSAPITKTSALFAPIVSSVFIGLLYYLLKFTDIDFYFGRLYQILGTTVGIFSFDSVFTSSVLSNFSFWTPSNKIFLNGGDSNQQFDNSDQGLLAGAIVGISYLSLYYFGIQSISSGDINYDSFFYLSLFNNLLACSIALQSVGLIRVESFAVACALLSGLFFYDIYWVFFSDVMMTVATKVEAPIKFLFPASLESMPSRAYPFSVLGLGDVVVPGVMAGLARRLDTEGIKKNIELPVLDITKSEPESVSMMSTIILKVKGLLKKEEENNKIIINSLSIAEQRVSEGKVSYLQYVTYGYIIGILAAFAANEITRSGQPALLYLVPTSIVSMIIAANKNGELSELWGTGLSTVSAEKTVDNV